MQKIVRQQNSEMLRNAYKTNLYEMKIIIMLNCDGIALEIYLDHEFQCS